MSEINSPDGADLYEDQPLYDAGNPYGVMAVSVHKVGGKCHCNIWLDVNGIWKRLLEERILEDREPSLYMLMGEIIRFAKEESKLIDEDLRMKLAVIGLQNAISSKIEARPVNITK